MFYTAFHEGLVRHYRYQRCYLSIKTDLFQYGSIQCTVQIRWCRTAVGHLLVPQAIRQFLAIFEQESLCKIGIITIGAWEE